MDKVKRYIVCTDNGKWYEIEATNPNEAIKKLPNKALVVEMVFNELEQEEC